MRKFMGLVASLAALSGARAQTIVDDWANVKAPPPPSVESVRVDPKTDALLLLDFDGRDAADSGPCNRATKPRCIASLPKIGDALAKARKAGVLVVYSLAGRATPGDIWPEIAPQTGEPIVRSGPDKFIDTDLRSILETHAIKRVIVTGTASEGAVLNTASDAAFHGMSVVIPLDGMSSTALYAEQYVAWHMTHAPGVAQKTKLTTLEQLQF